jgi:hypothetical protein
MALLFSREYVCCEIRFARSDVSIAHCIACLYQAACCITRATTCDKTDLYPWERNMLGQNSSFPITLSQTISIASPSIAITA